MKRITLFVLLLCTSFVSAQDTEAHKLLGTLNTILAKQEVPPVKDVVGKGRGYIPLTAEKRKEMQAKSNAAHGGRIAMLAKNLALPATFDCRDKGWLVTTGDQGQCGSCYLYSTIYGTLTASFIIAGYAKNDGSFLMAVQYGMDCHNFGGCNGGNGTEVIDWLCTNGWPAEKYIDAAGVSHNDYPRYSASSQACRKVAGAKLWKPATWGFVNANGNPSIEEIKAAMYKYGPINIAIDAGGQFGNGTGTITSLGNSIDHEINCVGWDDNKQAFLLWNQWSTDWGTGGFRWCSYAASKHIVDWFWISVDPLPPPPPPVTAAPVITSAGAIQVAANAPFTYQITATNSPTGFSAFGMPAGWTCSASGLISGVATDVSKTIIIAAVNASGTGTASLVVASGVIPPPVPPGPGGAKITLSMDMKAGTYALLDDSDVAALKAIMAKINSTQVSTTKEPPQDEAMLRLLNVVEKLNKRIVELEKQLAEPKATEPKKTSQLSSPAKEYFHEDVYPSIRISDGDRLAGHLARIDNCHEAQGSRSRRDRDSSGHECIALGYDGA